MAASLLERAIVELDPLGGEQSIEQYNDGHTHAEVLAVYDRAIELSWED